MGKRQAEDRQTARNQMDSGSGGNPYQLTKTENYFSNGFMLAVHLVFFFWYWSEQMTILFWYNLVSILVFIVNFYLIRTDRQELSSYLSFAEIFLFMSMNVLCLGWDYGFQFYCFGFLTSALLFDALLEDGRQFRQGSRWFITLDFVWFILLRLWTYHFDPVYTQGSERLRMIMYLVNAVSTLLLILAFVTSHLKKSRALEERLHRAATRDALTGLYNRRYADGFMRYLFSEPYDLAIPVEDDPYARGTLPDLSGSADSKGWQIAIMDIDHFKAINDHYGHAAGDAVLEDLGKFLLELQETCQVPILCARWGGEEFLLAIRCGQDTRAFHEIHRQIRDRRAAFHADTISWTVTIGVCGSEEAGSFDEVLQIADERLYQGKIQGRDKVVAGI